MIQQKKIPHVFSRAVIKRARSRYPYPVPEKFQTQARLRRVRRSELTDEEFAATVKRVMRDAAR